MLKICKFGISMLYINLYLIYTVFNSYIPFGTIIFSGIAALSMLILVSTDGFALLSDIKKEIISIGAFILVAIAGAILTAYNRDVAISATIGYSEKFLYLLIIYVICKIENRCDFPINLCAFLGVSAAIIVLTNSNLSISRISLSSNVSENALGNLMVLSIFSVIYITMSKRWGFIGRLVAFMLVVMMIYVIYLTGSRKSLYALGIMGIAYFALYIARSEKSHTVNASTFVFVIVVVVLLILFRDRIDRILDGTAMHNRLYGAKALRAAESNVSRQNYYIRAYEHFLESPLLGIGFNNFLYLHGSYTHSTYAEIYCGTGLLGIVTYFFQYYEIIRKINIRKNIDRDSTVFHFCVAFFIAYCFIGIGIGQMYDYISIMGMAVIYSSINISADSAETQRINRAAVSRYIR